MDISNPTQGQLGNVDIKDLTAQQVADIQRRVTLDVKKGNPFDRYFEKRTWTKGSAAMTFRALVPKHNVDPDNFGQYELLADIAPDFLTLSYATYSISFPKSWGTKAYYNWKELIFSKDSIVSDLSSELTQWGVDMKTTIEGLILLKGTSNIVTFSGMGGTLMKLFDRVGKLFVKMGCKPREGSTFDCLCSSEVSDKLTEELLTTYGANYHGMLPVDETRKTLTGYISNYKKISLIDPSYDKLMIHKNASGEIQGYYLIFLAKSPRGENPAVLFRLSDGDEVRHNPLGSEILTTRDGKYTSDDNGQLGSMAMNIKGFTGHITDDRAIIVCEVPSSYISDGIYVEDDAVSAPYDGMNVYNFKTFLAAKQAKTPVDKQDFLVRKNEVAYEESANRPALDPAEPISSSVAPQGAFALDKETASVKAGAQVTLSVVGSTSPLSRVKWSSSDKTKATVEDGVVTGVAAGEATITAKVGDLSASCVVTVSA